MRALEAMSRVGLVALGSLGALAGCAFPTAGTSSDGLDEAVADAAIGPPRDAAIVVDADLRPDAIPLPDPCTDPSLVLCLPFGDKVVDVTAIDQAGFDNSALMTDVTPTDRLVAGAGDAIALDDSALHISLDSELNVPAPLTYAAWVKLGPTNALDVDKVRVLDNNDQYGMFIHTAGGGDNRKVRCTVNGQGEAKSDEPLDDQWHHLACVLAGGQSKLYVDGVLQEMKGFNTLAQTGQGGTCLGCNCIPGGPAPSNDVDADRLPGALDDVKLWSRALTAAELCAEAEQTSCQ
jgi:hypothetical protein